MKLSNLVNRQLRKRLGVQVERVDPSKPYNVIDADWDDIHSVEGWTMTSLAQRFLLQASLRHVVKANIPGSFVEVGVWRGGMLQLAAKTLQRLDDFRDIHAIDTFEGMTPPTARDRVLGGGPSAEQLMLAEPRQTKKKEQWTVWCDSPLQDVQDGMRSTGYPENLAKFWHGSVTDRTDFSELAPIAVLRIDVDWFDATLHSLVHLFPSLSPGGVLLLDDYDHWQGAREAIDEYFADSPSFLVPVSFPPSGRLLVKA